MDQSRSTRSLQPFSLMALFIAVAISCNLPNDRIVIFTPRDETKCSGEAVLCGERQVPPVESKGTGQFTFSRTLDGTLNYTLSAEDMQGNVIYAALHLATCRDNGEVIAEIFPDSSAQGGVQANGQLISGSLRDADLINAFAGRTVEDLCGELEAGNVYVNIYSTAFPDGELRGQTGRSACPCWPRD